MIAQQSTADWAERYVTRFGLALVQIPPGQKAPRKDGWNKPGGYVTNPASARRLWRNHANHGMGAVLGPSRLVSLDVDSPEHAIPALAELGIDLVALRAASPCIIGNPARCRLMFRAPEGVELSRKALVWPAGDGVAKPIVVFELRAGPVQDVLPPSVHPETRQPYRWENPPQEGFPRLPPALLELWLGWDAGYKALLEELCPWRPKPELTRAPRGPDSRADIIGSFNARHSVAELLEAHGYKRRGKRFVAPSSSSGLPGVTLLDEGRTCYSHHASDLLADGHAHDAFDCCRLLDHNGDMRSAVKAAAEELLGIEKAPRQGEAGATGSTADSSASSNEFNEFTNLLHQEREWPTLPPEALHGLAGDIVRTIAPHTEADPAAILVQLLIAFGSIIGRGPHYRVEADQHPTNLFALLVGETAKGRKGTSWGQVRNLTEMINDPWARERIMSGLSSGEGLIWQVRDPIYGRERVGKGKDARYQEVETDPGVKDKRLLVIEAEFASTLRVMGRDGNTLSALIRMAWDRGDLRTMTKNSPAVATGALVSIVGHITVDELRRYLDRTEAGNGFANRFLFVCVRRSRCLPDGGNLDEEAMKPHAERLARAIGQARRTERVRMTAQARAIWHRVYPELSQGLPGMLGAVTSRAEAQVVRLALLYALIESETHIDTLHLKAALAVWEYAEASARFVFGSALGDPVADEILRALQANRPHGMSRTDISGLFKRNQDAQTIGQALDLLASRELAHSKRERGDGACRPTETWYAK